MENIFAMFGLFDNATQDVFSVDLPVESLINGSYLDSLVDFPNNVTSEEPHTADKPSATPPTLLYPTASGNGGKKDLKYGFMLHSYGFGCLFFMLAFYTFFSILNLRSFISDRPFMSTINGFLCLLGTSRAGSLLIDPYSLKERMPRVIGQILWDLGFPSIISAFCLVQLAFFQLTQLKLGPVGLRKKSCLSLIVTAHFTMTIGVDIFVSAHDNLTAVKQVIQYTFLSWGVFLCCSFLYSGYKVMSLIRNIPGEFKPDPTHKGIMQLAMLAPYNNLAGSVTAALLPTLCAPKIHQQENSRTSTMGFRSDTNSRILESESIPMLEDMAGSSGDERSPRSLVRVSSFQNQTRNSQKFNMKPKLSLKNSEQEDEGETPSPKSPVIEMRRCSSQNMTSPKSPLARVNRFDFSVKNKATEKFVTTKSINEFKNKIAQHRNSFENENFRFERKNSSLEQPVIEVRPPTPSTQSEDPSSTVPDILISSPGLSRRNSCEPAEKETPAVSKNEEDFNKIINQIRQDLSHVNGDEFGASSNVLTAEVHGRNQLSPDGRGRRGRRSVDDGSRRGSQVSEAGSRRGSSYSRRGSDTNRLGVDSLSGNSRRNSDITECDATPSTSPSIRGKRKHKSLSWKKKIKEENVEDCLLPRDNSSRDVSLTAILNHIAYVNRAAMTSENGIRDLEQEQTNNSKKSQVEWVLYVTYITAMWGLILCLGNMGKLYTPPDQVEFNEKSLQHIHNSTLTTSNREEDEARIFSAWSWLLFQTFCRALELAMGCAMANITRQPAAGYRHPHMLRITHRDPLYNI